MGENGERLYGVHGIELSLERSIEHLKVALGRQGEKQHSEERPGDDWAGSGQVHYCHSGATKGSRPMKEVCCI